MLCYAMQCGAPGDPELRVVNLADLRGCPATPGSIAEVALTETAGCWQPRPADADGCVEGRPEESGAQA